MTCLSNENIFELLWNESDFSKLFSAFFWKYDHHDAEFICSLGSQICYVH